MVPNRPSGTPGVGGGQALGPCPDLYWEKGHDLGRGCEAGAQEGAAAEHRSINKGPAGTDFNLHITYWCLLCSFQYGHLVLQGAWLGGGGPGPCGYLTAPGMPPVSL